jgi:MFS transporter, MHS family, proline/betaine transporter
LNKSTYQTLALATLGGALEFYDFIIFVFFANVIGQLFFPAFIPDWLRQLQTFGLFAIAYFARPLGGIVMAHFGDKIGRKRVFTFSIFLMAVPTLAIGFLPSYHSIGIWAPIALLVFRVLQGAAVGGEVPGAWVFVSEHVPRERIGLACGMLTAGLTGGILLGSIVNIAITDLLSPFDVARFGWRIAFLAGGVFGLCAALLRRWLQETPVFKEMSARKALAAELPIKTVLRDHWPAVLISALLTWMLTAGIVVIILMTPQLLVSRYHFPVPAVAMANCAATLTLTLGCILTGLISDRLGAPRTLVAGAIALAVATYLFYSSLVGGRSNLLPLYALVGLTVGIVSIVPHIMVKSFPPAIRFSGISFAYNVSYAIFGGLTPLIVTSLPSKDLLFAGYYVILLSLVGLGVGIFLQRSQWPQSTQ